MTSLDPVMTIMCKYAAQFLVLRLVIHQGRGKYSTHYRIMTLCMTIHIT